MALQHIGLLKLFPHNCFAISILCSLRCHEPTLLHLLVPGTRYNVSRRRCCQSTHILAVANECVSRFSRLAGIIDIDKLVRSARYNQACGTVVSCLSHHHQVQARLALCITFRIDVVGLDQCQCVDEMAVSQVDVVRRKCVWTGASP